MCFACATWLLLLSSCKKSCCCCRTRFVLTKTFLLLASFFYQSKFVKASKSPAIACFCLFLLQALLLLELLLSTSYFSPYIFCCVYYLCHVNILTPGANCSVNILLVFTCFVSFCSVCQHCFGVCFACVLFFFLSDAKPRSKKIIHTHTHTK